jgi:hypothetical protein
MAEPKKTKIDLKTRLGNKGAGASGRISAPPGGIPAPVITGPAIPTPGAAVPPPPLASGGIPVPPFAQPSAPVAPPKPTGPTVDPNDPYATVKGTPEMIRAPEIKIDTSDAAHEAAKGMRKFIAIAGVAAAVVGFVIGNVYGTGSESSRREKIAIAGAGVLSKDVETANVKVKELAEKITGVVASLKEKKFPENFATELGALNIPFDGDKLGGKGIGSYDGPTLKLLLAYTSDIEALNDRKDALKNLFSNQKTKITQALQSNEKPLIGFTLLVIKTPKGNAVGSLAPITEPFGLDADWPKEFKMKNTASGEVQTVTRYESADPTSTKDKRFGIPVEPSSLSAAFPNDITGKILGEVIKTGELLNGTGGEDGSPGLLKNGEALVASLKKIAAKLDAGLRAQKRASSGDPLGALSVCWAPGQAVSTSRE